MGTALVLDALEQALHARTDRDGLIHHSDRGIQYLSVRYTRRLTEAGVDGSVGSVGNSYDNALAESIIGLYKAEVIGRQGPRSEEHTSELQSRGHLVCRLLLENKNNVYKKENDVD